MAPDATLVPDSRSTSSETSGTDFLPSHASCINDIVFSMLLLLVLGLVIVVPKLAWRPCPRLNGVPDGEVGDTGEEGKPGDDRNFGPSNWGPLNGCEGKSSTGVFGMETRALPSSEFASTSSGGNRSFSISDLRLKWFLRKQSVCK